ncbi:MAG: hypothetical protein COC22_02870 [Flavobacteriaceae bacterium]|nr:MAG: hypothetical protein COC22_02870 [Flavobacteriaceae bacterium]
MRLEQQDAAAIKRLLTNTLGQDTKVWLFGSRVDDDKRGGDIDLYVEAKQPCPLATKLQLMTQIQKLVDMRKVDLVIHAQGDMVKDIGRTAILEGVQL